MTDKETPPFFNNKEKEWLIEQTLSPSLTRYWWNTSNGIKNSDNQAPADQGNRKKYSIPATYLVLPTGFDLQTHLRFPGQANKETLHGGLWSAFCGGYDGLLSMPNTNPFLDNAEVLRSTIAQAKQSSIPVEPLFSAAATIGMKGEEPTDILALAKAGAAAITDDGWGVKSPEAMKKIFSLCAQAGIPFLQHAEVGGHKGIATESNFQRQHQLPLYPRLAESAMVARDLEILEKVPEAHYHVLHISTRETISLIEKAKAKGLRVSAEVSPHHLFFCNENIPPENEPHSAYFKMNPPLFSSEDREALKLALKTGVIDFVSTDHAPHEKALKQQGWKLAPFGTRGLETTIPVLVSLWKSGILSLARFQSVWSEEPRKLLPMATASRGIIVIDPNAAWTITESDLPGISKNSCFIGQHLTGKILLRGEIDALWQRNS